MNVLNKVVPYVMQKVKRTSPKATPESKRIKNALNERLQELKPKRDKKSLASRRLLMRTVNPNQNISQTSPYKR